jgi:hypothetical protein
MRKTTWLALAALLVAPAAVAAQDNSQQSAPAQSSQSSQASQTSSSSNAAQEDPLAAAARKAREQQKNAPKTTKVFDNDNLPTEGGISTVGETSAAEKPEKKETAAEANPQGSKAADEWRSKFADLRKKLAADQGDLSVLQREAGQQMMQYYNGDPNKAYEDQQSNSPLGQKYDQTKAAIDAKQKQVEADQQAISDAEDALRKAGGDPGWER